MTITSNDLHRTELALALIEAKLKIIMKWHRGKQTLDPAIWSAITAELDKTPEFMKLLEATGHDERHTYDWAQGRGLPNANMCAVYADHLLKLLTKRATELNSELAALKSPKVRKSSAPKARTKIGWHDRKITGFNVPEGIKPGTRLEELPGYQDFDRRVRTAFKNENVQTVGELVDFHLRNPKNFGWTAEILRIPNLGRKSFNRLAEFLAQAGFTPVFED